MVVATVYFCRCFNWSNRTNYIFKDVTKEMTQHASKTPGNTVAAVGNSSDRTSSELVISVVWIKSLTIDIIGIG